MASTQEHAHIHTEHTHTYITQRETRMKKENVCATNMCAKSTKNIKKFRRYYLHEAKTRCLKRPRIPSK